MLKHCRLFRELDIWYLAPTETMYQRKLYIGVCPVCGTDVAMLSEIQKSDDSLFVQVITGHKKVEKLCDKVRHHIETTYQETIIQKGQPCGFVYGVNKEIKNQKIRQYACDFFGQRRIIKELKIS